MAHRAAAVVINEKDNVATALRMLPAGTAISLTIGIQNKTIHIITDVPAGHKFALTNIPRGADVIKYGEPIGQSIAIIEQGEHVHSHNVISPDKKRN